MRLDIERKLQLDAGQMDAISDWLQEADKVEAIVLSDYAKGVLTPTVIRRVISIAQSRRIPVVVDPKSQEAAARILREKAQVRAVVLTRGAQGMTIYDPFDIESEVTHVSTVASEIFDVSGAGDTVVASLALALASGAPVTTAARIGNTAAGIAVGKRGTAVVQARELSVALRGDEASPKIVDGSRAAAIVADWKTHRLRVGFTNGCFDVLHPRPHRTPGKVSRRL